MIYRENNKHFTERNSINGMHRCICYYCKLIKWDKGRGEYTHIYYVVFGRGVLLVNVDDSNRMGNIGDGLIMIMINIETAATIISVLGIGIGIIALVYIARDWIRMWEDF